MLNWCNSKCGVENFEEHWAKAEPKNSISHLIYRADNPLYAHKYFALVFRQQNFQFATLPCLIGAGVYYQGWVSKTSLNLYKGWVVFGSISYKSGT